MSRPVPAPFAGLGRAEVTDRTELTPVDDYRRFTLSRVPVLEPIELPLREAPGHVLVWDITTPTAIPPFRNSAMDGYAVVAADTTGATVDGPVRLVVGGEVMAGSADLPEVGPGVAVRVMTGARVPEGADAVVPVETTSAGEGSDVRIHRPVMSGQHVREAGEDVEAGAVVLERGRRLGAADVGLLAAIGVHQVPVVAAPRVVVLSTGDELVAPSEEPGPGQLRNSNGPMLTAMVAEAGGVPFNTGVVPDDPAALERAFDQNVGHADVIITTGGVSMGLHDHLREVLGRLGETAAFRVAMKPGMPQVFARVGNVPVFALPGNPVSAFVSFEVFVRPALRRMMGRSDLTRPTVRAELTEEVHAPRDKRMYLRVRLRREEGRWLATPTGPQGSHLLSSLARADGLAEIAEDVDRVRPGDLVRVHLIVAD